MNIDPDFAIFRRFGDLQAALLLYRQAELEKLERTLRNLDHAREDKEKNGKRLESSWMTEIAEKDSIRVQIVNDIRSSMKLYSMQH